MMNLTFLGTNGWFDTKTGVTPCILIDCDSAYIVLDAGNGLYKLDRYIKDTKKPIYLFISHVHLDHVFGLHILNKFQFSQKMTILASRENSASLRTLLTEPFTVSPDKLRTRTELHVFDDKNIALPFSVIGMTLAHSSPNTGFRFELEGKTIVYTGDTGVCENTAILAKNADILIHECSFESGHAKSAWGHVAPEDAARVAKESHVGRLLLTHFDARIYTTLDMRYEAQKEAQKIFPNSQIMVDDQTIRLL